MAIVSTIQQFSFLKREFLAEAKQVNHNPRAAITLCTCYLELMVNSIIKLRCKRGGYLIKKNIPLQGKVDLLYELGIINSNLYHDIGLLIGERNKAAHDFDYDFNHGITKKLKYLKKAPSVTREEVKNTNVPWIHIGIDLVFEVGNIVFSDVVKIRK